MKIQSTGGFGNQLFQWSYAHHLKLQEADKEVVVFRDSIHSANRESHLGLIANNCIHDIHFESSELTGRVLQALDKSGGVDYLEARANDPKTAGAFLSLIGKVLPMTIAGDADNPLKMITTIERVIVRPKN